MTQENAKTTKRWVPMPPTYVWSAIALMAVLHFVCPWIRWVIPRPYNWLGSVLVMGGIALAWVPELQFKKVGTEVKPPGNDGPVPDQPPPDVRGYGCGVGRGIRGVGEPDAGVRDPGFHRCDDGAVRCARRAGP
jgi:hypothetical protein